MVESRLAAVNAHFNPKQVKVTVSERVAVVQMDPPTKLIFLAKPLILELNEIFMQLERDDDVSVVILTGKGNSFATGANIKEIADMTSKKMLTDDYFERDWWRILPNFRKPFIAAINGMAFGGGLEVAMMADILVCTANAKLGQPEINLGILPGSGGTVRLTQAVGKSKAMEMCLTGEPIGAEDALKWGLVSQVYPNAEAMMQGATTLAKKIASKSQMAAGYTKRAVKQALEVGETAAIAHERSLFIAALNTHDKQEGTTAFMKKRKPNFQDK